jgi:hypothetical protein
LLRKLILIACLLASGAVAAQDRMDAENPHGLLGQRYLSGQFMFQQPIRDHQSLYDIDSTSTIALNLPVPWTENNIAAFSQDVFFSMNDLNPFRNEKATERFTVIADNIGNFSGIEVRPDPITGANISAGLYDRYPVTSVPRYTYLRTSNYDWHTFQIGTTLYGAIRDDLRPFVQVGYSYSTYRQDSGVTSWTFASAPALPGATSMTGPGTVRHQDHRVLCNLGIEYDLNDRMTFRPQLDLDTRYLSENSRCSAQLIWWFRKNWFVSPGLVCNVNATQPGGLMHVGLRF